MKKFQFRFEQILKHKRRVEERLEESLAQNEHAVRQAWLEVIAVENQLRDLKNRILAMQSGHLQLSQLVVATHYLSRLKEVLEEKKVHFAEAEARRDETRGLLIEAMKERKMFDKLKEKELQKWRQEENQWEQRLMDEIAQRRTRVHNTMLRYGGGT